MATISPCTIRSEDICFNKSPTVLFHIFTKPNALRYLIINNRKEAKTNQPLRTFKYSKPYSNLQVNVSAVTFSKRSDSISFAIWFIFS